MIHITIDTDLGIFYEDLGPWRSYQLITEGSSLSELYHNAIISEIDQDGGELNYYSPEDGTNEVQRIADLIVYDTWYEKQRSLIKLVAKLVGYKISLKLF